MDEVGKIRVEPIIEIRGVIRAEVPPRQETLARVPEEKGLFIQEPESEV
jgi:hypothetical protein